MQESKGITKIETAIVILLIISILLSASVVFYTNSLTSSIADIASDVTKLLGAGPEPVEQEWKDTLSMATMKGEPDTLDIGYCKGSTMALFELRAIYESLVEIPAAGTTNHIPKLAESWDISPDGTVYTFHLRKNVKFHSGNLFTSADVIYSWDRDRNINISTVEILDKWVKNWTALDDYTVRVNLITRGAPGIILDVFGSWVTAIIDSEYADAHGGMTYGPTTKNPYLVDHPSGTGPFMVGDFGGEWKKGEYILLRYHPNYWRGWTEGKHVKNIMLRFISETSTQLMLLTKGDLDIASLKLEMIPDVEGMIKDQGLDWYLPGLTESGTRTNFLEMNTRDLPFSDMNARLAVTHCFDYATFHTTVSLGYGHRCKNVVYHVVLPLMPQDIPVDQFDPVKAKEYYDKVSPEAKALMEAGWEIIIRKGHTMGEGAALVLKENLAKHLGLTNVRVTVLDPATFSTKVHNMECTMDGLGMTPMSMDPFSSILWKISSSSRPPFGWSIGSWDSNYINATTDELVINMTTELDPTKRAEMIRQICMIEYNLHAKVFLDTEPGVYRDWGNVFRGYVKGYVWHPVGDYYEWASSIYKER